MCEPDTCEVTYNIPIPCYEAGFSPTTPCGSGTVPTDNNCTFTCLNVSGSLKWRHAASFQANCGGLGHHENGLGTNCCECLWDAADPMLGTPDWQDIYDTPCALLNATRSGKCFQYLPKQCWAVAGGGDPDPCGGGTGVDLDCLDEACNPAPVLSTCGDIFTGHCMDPDDCEI